MLIQCKVQIFHIQVKTEAEVREPDGIDSILK
jgi:hypothetical protein